MHAVLLSSTYIARAVKCLAMDGTLTGHLLHKLGTAPKKIIDKNEKDAATVNKKSFKYAWVSRCKDPKLC